MIGDRVALLSREADAEIPAKVSADEPITERSFSVLVKDLNQQNENGHIKHKKENDKSQVDNVTRKPFMHVWSTANALF